MKQSEKDLNKALNLAIGSFAGIVVPIVGLVLSFVAWRIAHGTKESVSNASKKTTVQILAVVAALLSFAVGVIYFNYYQTVATKAKEDRLEQQRKEEQQRSKEELEEYSKKYGLEICLSNAAKWWDDNVAGKRATYQQQELYLRQYESYKEDCYRKYQ